MTFLDAWMRWVLIALTLVSLGCGRNVGTIVVTNQTEETIADTTVRFSWGESVSAKDIAPGASATVTYTVREGDWGLEAVFRSGRQIRSHGWYVTPGVDFRSTARVTPTEIQIDHVAINPYEKDEGKPTMAPR